MLFHKRFFFALAHTKGCVVREGFLVSADHGDCCRGGTSVHRKILILHFSSCGDHNFNLALTSALSREAGACSAIEHWLVQIPTLEAAGRVSFHPREKIAFPEIRYNSIPCLFGRGRPDGPDNV
jgi:hypothetical protein